MSSSVSSAIFGPSRRTRSVLTTRRPRPREVRSMTAGHVAVGLERQLDEILRRSLGRHPHRPARGDDLEAVPLAGQRADHGVERGHGDGLEQLVVGPRRLVRARAPFGGADARRLDGGTDPAADVRNFHRLIVSQTPWDVGRTSQVRRLAIVVGRTSQVRRVAMLIAIKPPSSGITRLSSKPARASIAATPAAPG